MALLLPETDYLKSLFEYRDGELYWKSSRGRVKRGSKAGCTRKDGYSTVKIDQKLFLSHRIIWKLHTGTDPNLIDHIDRDPKNNRIENLRSVDGTTNQLNTTAHCVKADCNRFVSRVQVEGKIYFKRFDTEEQAVRHTTSFRKGVIAQRTS